MTRSCNEITRRYFLAPARPPEFMEGSPPAWVRTGSAGRRAEGTRIHFELHLGVAGPDDGIVKSARFSVYGCPHTLAVVAWLCEVLEGARIDACQPGTPAEWAEKFEVPAEKLGRLLIVEDALRLALAR